jgi:DNA-directed RNA polymerase subunit H (RpoH/RPB5)
MTTPNHIVLQLFKSRQNLLVQLAALGYDVADHSEFSIHEIDAMFVNNQLNLLLNHTKTQAKVLVYYHASPLNVSKAAKQLKADTLDKVLEEVMEGEGTLTRADTLVVMMEEEPNESILKHVRFLYDKKGVFVVLRHLKRLMFNLLDHVLIPPVRVLDDAETEALKAEHHLAALQHLPEIARFDPLALALLLRPGQVIRCVRGSQTALEHEFFRVCV